MKQAVIVLVIATLGACDKRNNDSTEEEIPKQVSIPAGIFHGAISSQGTTFSTTVLINSTGETRFISKNGAKAKYQMSINGTNFSANGRNFDEHGEFIGQGKLTGEYTQNSISGSADFSGVKLGDFNFELQEGTHDGASLETLQGNYVALDNESSLAIDIDGVMTGSDVYGCIYTGQVTLTDAKINIYSLAVTVEQCLALAGEYKGLGAYNKNYDGKGSEGFIFQMDKDDFALSTVLLK